MSAPAAVHTPFIQGSDEWLEARLDGIGSSDAPIIAREKGSLVELWAYKTRKVDVPVPDEETQRLFRRGHILEPAIATMYSEQKDRPLRVVNQMRRRRDLPWALASLDRVSAVKGERRIVELKSTRSARWNEVGPEGVPGDVFAQVQHQLWVTEYEVADVAVLTAGFDLRVIEVPRDDDYLGDLVYLERDFWDHVEAGSQPAVDETEDTARALARLHPRETLPLLAPTPEIDLMVRQLAQARGEARDAANLEASIKNAIRALLGESAGVEGDGYRITWTKNRDSTVVETNWEAIASAYRQLLAEAFERRSVAGAMTALTGAPLPFAQALDAIEGLHTTTTVKEGPRVLRTTGALFPTARTQKEIAA